MSVPLRYSRHRHADGAAPSMDTVAGAPPAPHTALPDANARPMPQVQQRTPQHQQPYTPYRAPIYQTPYQAPIYRTPYQQPQLDPQKQVAHLFYSPLHGHMPPVAHYGYPGMISPESVGSASSQSPQPHQIQVQRQNYRADRTLGRIVNQQERTAHPNPIRLPISPTKPAELVGRTPARRHQKPQIDDSKCSVSIRLPSRRVSKHVSVSMTCAELSILLIKEHRLEFDFDLNRNGSDDLILWECLDGTQRPLRATERIGPIVQRWGSHNGFLRTTSTTLRNDVDSLASLVPRRDMLKKLPSIVAAVVHFSRPSIMYDPLLNQGVQSRHGNYSPQSPSPSSLACPLTSHLISSQKSGAALCCVPSKLNPNDRSLRTAKIEADNDDFSLQTQLVWGFGSLNLENGRLVLKQKPGDELVCSLETAGTDIYEWPHQGPKAHVLVLRAQQRNSRAVFVSTDSANVFSVLRNAVFTARTKALLDSQRN